MIALPNGAKLSFSRKRWWETLAEPMETTQGRSCLAYPKRSEDAAEFPRGRMAERSTFTATPGARRMRISSPASKTQPRALAGLPWSDLQKVT
jgi:hypothetical protein